MKKKSFYIYKQLNNPQTKVLFTTDAGRLTLKCAIDEKIQEAVYEYLCKFYYTSITDVDNLYSLMSTMILAKLENRNINHSTKERKLMSQYKLWIKFKNIINKPDKPLEI